MAGHLAFLAVYLGGLGAAAFGLVAAARRPRA
jgi:hypothetical protein